MAERADLVVLAVKPAALDEVAAELAAARSGRLAARRDPARAARGRLPGGRGDAGDAERRRSRSGGGCSASPAAPPPEVREKLELLGHVVEIADARFDAATAVMGCAPAYLALAVEAIAEAGAATGSTRSWRGSWWSRRRPGRRSCCGLRHPAELRRPSPRPGGSTEAGLEALDREGAAEAFAAAVRGLAGEDAGMIALASAAATSPTTSARSSSSTSS